MKTIIKYSKSMFGELRTTITDDTGEPWFVAMDICSALGLTPRDSVRCLDEDEKSHVSREHLGMNPGKPVLIINESGLYSLILRSRKPEAKRFKKWVTSEVLPSIRKTGSYGHQFPQTFSEALHLYADEVAQKELIMAKRF